MAPEQRHRARPQVEHLEDRQLLAAHVNISFNALQGVVNVQGTRGNDTVIVSFARGANVRVGMPGHGHGLFPRALVREVVVHNNGGRDRVVNRTNLPVVQAAPTALDARPSQATQPVSTAGLSADEALVLQVTNAERASRGLPALVLNSQLEQAARTRASTEAATDTYFADGGFPQDVNATGYPWTNLGQNDAYNWGYGNPAQQLTVQWWNSPPHQANILDRGFTEVGVAVATSASGKTYGVVVFGSR